MTKHEGGQWLMTMGKIAPIEVGLDSSVRIVVIKVQIEQVWICKGRCKACHLVGKVVCRDILKFNDTYTNTHMS